MEDLLQIFYSTIVVIVVGVIVGLVFQLSWFIVPTYFLF